MREAYRLQKMELQEKLEEQNYHLAIFFIYTGKGLPMYKEVYEKTGKALEKLCILISKAN